MTSAPSRSGKPNRVAIADPSQRASAADGADALVMPDADTLVLDDLRFAVRRSPHRATVDITIERDGSLTLSAPIECSRAQLEQIARDKRFWIYTKLAEKNELAWPAARKEYVTGEGFWYLGRSYRLRVLDPDPAVGSPAVVAAPLRLHQGRFLLHRAETPQAREHFVRWYIEHGTARLSLLVQDLAERIAVQPQSLRVRDLGHRWGSCGHHAQTLNFHWRAVLLPPRIIEYIVAHELVHLHEPHHDQHFWRRLERTIPDYAARKSWLAQHGARYSL